MSSLPAQTKLMHLWYKQLMAGDPAELDKYLQTDAFLVEKTSN
jgi:hypothetical protein